MSAPFKVCAPRKGKDGKTYWTRIGAAFPRDSGGMSVVLDALPLGNELMIFPPDPPGQKGRNSGPDDAY
jgi:hypothetical protein